jgi:PKHD-type hydroxylase
MLLSIPQVLSTEQVRQCRAVLDAAQWIDGRATAGYQGAKVKENQQLPENSPVAHELGDLVLAALERNSLFISAALPSEVYPPMFNRYEGGGHFGSHIDNAVRLLPGSGRKIRTDVSATLFLAEPHEYDGGELLIEDTYGVQSVKLAAGDMIVYPSTSVHRAMLFDLDTAIQRLNETGGDERAIVSLTGCYHNLLRMWSSP